MLLSEVFFFFNDTATTEIYTLSLHDALPISDVAVFEGGGFSKDGLLWLPASVERPSEHPLARAIVTAAEAKDRKSTRLNSSHSQNSHAVFCLKKKESHARSGRAFATYRGYFY